MATTRVERTVTSVGDQIEARNQTTSRTLGATRKLVNYRKNRCNRAKRAYALAQQAWIDAGKPTSGPEFNAVLDADIDVFIFCELP